MSRMISTLSFSLWEGVTLRQSQCRRLGQACIGRLMEYVCGQSRFRQQETSQKILERLQDFALYNCIHSNVSTQPNQLQVRAKFGSNTNGGEVEGSGAYNYAVVLGCTRALSLRVWLHTDSAVERIRIMPNLTVNKEHSYSDTDGWNIGGGASFNAGGGGGHRIKYTNPCYQSLRQNYSALVRFFVRP